MLRAARVNPKNLPMQTKVHSWLVPLHCSKPFWFKCRVVVVAAGSEHLPSFLQEESLGFSVDSSRRVCNMWGPWISQDRSFRNCKCDPRQMASHEPTTAPAPLLLHHCSHTSGAHHCSPTTAPSPLLFDHCSPPLLPHHCSPPLLLHHCSSTTAFHHCSNLLAPPPLPSH